MGRASGWDIFYELFHEPRMPAKHDGVEQGLFVHESKRRMIGIDGDRAGGSVEAACNRTIPRAFAPELFGRRAGLGSERDTGLRAQSFVRLQRPKIVERVGHDVAVDARAESNFVLTKGSEVGKPIA